MKKNRGYLFILLSIFQLTAFRPLLAQKIDPLSPVESNGIWIQPSASYPSVPTWGHKEGIRIGIAPTPGPRGLIRIYAPYLGHREDKMINFIAIEPITVGEEQRGFSELETSDLDQVKGKRFWSADNPKCGLPLSPTSPAKGVIEVIDGVETLSIYIFSEIFINGALPFIKIMFYENRPYELELTTYACPGSKDLEHLILTATMGNFARLRKLYLSNVEKTSLDLWPEYSGIHFTSHDVAPVEQMITNNKGNAYFIAEPDEDDPVHVEYAPGTKENWMYYGEKATQYWYAPDPDPELKGLVNGRYTYWASESPIPGGISFENFELKSPFKNGEKFVFGIVPLPASEFIKVITQDGQVSGCPELITSEGLISNMDSSRDN